MKKERKLIIAGNWEMNTTDFESDAALFSEQRRHCMKPPFETISSSINVIRLMITMPLLTT
jgi:hypothetical protein